MRFAIHQQKRIEATPGAQGQCAGCGEELVSKCGNIKVWHWAHKGKHHCAKWWENETQWHREWKDRFPIGWQEVIARDDNGEIHFADIKTPNGLVIEFQHSPIRIQERTSREDFYGNMIWVLNGLSETAKSGTFSLHIQSKKQIYVDGILTVRFNPHVPWITQKWINSRKVVFLDFGEDHLWRIPVEQDGWAKSANIVKKSEFINALLDGREPLAVSNRRTAKIF